MTITVISISIYAFGTGIFGDQKSTRGHPGHNIVDIVKKTENTSEKTLETCCHSSEYYQQKQL